MTSRVTLNDSNLSTSSPFKAALRCSTCPDCTRHNATPSPGEPPQNLQGPCPLLALIRARSAATAQLRQHQQQQTPVTERDEAHMSVTTNMIDPPVSGTTIPLMGFNRQQRQEKRGERNLNKIRLPLPVRSIIPDPEVPVPWRDGGALDAFIARRWKLKNSIYTGVEPRKKGTGEGENAPRWHQIGAINVGSEIFGL
uniref:Uncharacterized protein n=1 Tax=Oryza punctata TaxID=4537 RepID=A0A0E0MKW2_ORYPU